LYDAFSQPSFCKNSGVISPMSSTSSNSLSEIFIPLLVSFHSLTIYSSIRIKFFLPEKCSTNSLSKLLKSFFSLDIFSIKLTRSEIIFVISFSLSKVKIPFSIETPIDFNKPIPGPASYLSKPASNNSFIVLFFSVCEIIQFQILSSSKPFSIALIPSEPNVTNFIFFSMVSTNSFSSKDLPAPAT
tara:strand:+ start:12595 stop:13152 length:558 start_codon:yes stop_codon:yes gene_type:complete